MPINVKSRRRNPLEADIESAGGRLRTTSITGKRKSRSDDNVNDNGYIDAKSSKKILSIAQDLVDEEDAQRQQVSKNTFGNEAFTFDSRFTGLENEDLDIEQTKYQDEEEWLPEDDVVQEDLDPEDMAIYNKFLQNGEDLADFAPSLENLTTSENQRSSNTRSSPGQETQTINLADLILQRIREKEDREAAQLNGAAPSRFTAGHGPPDDAVEIPLKVVDTFTKVGQILSRYKSGPLPKPFKVLPTLPQWPDLLAITRPESWTPNAVYRATKIFISAKPITGQIFCETILLDRVRDDIHETKRLNVHLYNSIKAAFYRPSAFFKGFLFPLVQSGTCTLREATIVSSALAKIKIPVLHSAAALLRLCEISAEQTSSVNTEAAGSANIFIRVLLSKKYALPYRVVDALVFHFLRFRATKASAADEDGDEDGDTSLGSKEAKLPVLWHQSLLIFAQTYRNEITEDQREALLDLLLARGHKEIGPEVRRELLAGRNRGVKLVTAEDVGDGDDTMDMGS